MICGISLVFGENGKIQGICGNSLELCMVYKFVRQQQKYGFRFAVCCFILPTNRSIALSWHKPQNNTKTNDNGNSNLACFIRTHYFRYTETRIQLQITMHSTAQQSTHTHTTSNIMSDIKHITLFFGVCMSTHSNSGRVKEYTIVA